MRTRFLSTLAGALLLTVLATLLTAALPARALQPVPSVSPVTSVPAAAGGAVRAADPAQDYPQMPVECTPAARKIPTTPVACALNAFEPDRPTVLLWGDSHAWMFIPALQAAVEERDVNLVVVTMGSCPPMDNAVARGAAVPDCFRSNEIGIRTVEMLAAAGQPYRVVLSGSWERYVNARATGDRRSYIGRMAQAMTDGLPRLARTLDSLGADVDVIGQVATVPTRRAACAAGEAPYVCPVSRAKAMPDVVPTRAYVAKVLRPVLGSRPAIDVSPYFCDDTTCRGTVGSTLTWFDDLHLSATMSAELAPFFTPTVDAVAPAPPAVEAQPCTIPIICP